MIKSIKVTNYLGESLDLELARPEKSGFAVYNIDGLGSTNADVNVKEVATKDGGRFTSARAKTRDINLTLRYYGDDIESIRQKSYKYFPVKKKIRLTFYTDNRTLYIDGYVEENEVTITSTKGGKAGSAISIVCADPYFYSLENEVTQFSAINSEFEFPFNNNSLTAKQLEFGEVILKQYNVINYEGDVESGVIIQLHALGSVGDISIYNITTNQKMSISKSMLVTMTGSGVVANDTITINTTTGNKSVMLLREGVEYNILNCLGKSTSWFKVSKGDNIFTYVASDETRSIDFDEYEPFADYDGSSNLQFTIKNPIIYEGV